MDKRMMPLPQPPQPPTKPRGFFLVYLAALFGLVLTAAMTFFIMGTIWPFLIGFGVLAIIALQYAVWGWWFERIYRSGTIQEQDEDHTWSNESEFQRLKDAYRRFRFLLARIAGFVAIAYGAITFNAYFFFLGIAAVSLFWLWDRMIKAEHAKWASMKDDEANDGDEPN
ncbi:MAG TPA: hypothetical protein VGI40_10095 [Pirellulaceae bacterium]